MGQKTELNEKARGSALNTSFGILISNVNRWNSTMSLLKIVLLFAENSVKMQREKLPKQKFYF